jgi:hypothetical protein
VAKVYVKKKVKTREKGVYSDNVFNEKSVNKELVEDLNGLHCFYTNADSLPNKCDELKARVQNAAEKYDIIGVTKVYPKSCRYSPGKAELQLLGYELYFNESGENKRGIILEMI